jgi:hypothetical protein
MSFKGLALGAVAAAAMGAAAHPAAAQTATFSSPIIYGSPAQVLAVCYITNTGTTAVTLSSSGILNQNGAAIILKLNSCIGTVVSGVTCQIVGNIAFNMAYRCKTVVSPSASASALRGDLELRDAKPSVIQHIALQ